MYRVQLDENTFFLTFSELVYDCVVAKVFSIDDVNYKDKKG